MEQELLTREDFIRILIEPRNALIKQYTGLLKTDAITISFVKEAINVIALTAIAVNDQTQNIGAWWLYTIVTTRLEDILFEVPDGNPKRVRIIKSQVQSMLKDIVSDEDLSRYIL